MTSKRPRNGAVNLLESLTAEKLEAYCKSLPDCAQFNDLQAAIFISVLFRPGTTPSMVKGMRKTRKLVLRLRNVAKTADGRLNLKFPRVSAGDIRHKMMLRSADTGRDR